MCSNCIEEENLFKIPVGRKVLEDTKHIYVHNGVSDSIFFFFFFFFVLFLAKIHVLTFKL